MKPLKIACRTNVDLYPFSPLKDWGFWNFFQGLAPGFLDGFSIGKVLEGASIFQPFCAWFESAAMWFFGGKSLGS